MKFDSLKKIDWSNHLVTLLAVALGGLLSTCGQTQSLKLNARKDFLVTLAKEGPANLAEMTNCINEVYDGSFEPFRTPQDAALQGLEKKVEVCLEVFDRAALQFSLYAKPTLGDKVRQFSSQLKNMETLVSDLQQAASGGHLENKELSALPEAAIDITSNWTREKAELLKMMQDHLQEQANTLH